MDSTRPREHRRRDRVVAGVLATAAAAALSAPHGDSRPPDYKLPLPAVASAESLQIRADGYLTFAENRARDRLGLGSTQTEATTPEQRARATDTAMRQNLAIGDTGYFFNDTTNGNVASVWQLGQIIAGQEDYSLVGGPSANPGLNALRLYDVREQTESYAPGIGPQVVPPSRYIDDNLWIALDLLQDYQTTGNVDALHKAESLYDFFAANATPQGGMHWVERTDSPSRNAVSNLPAVEYGVRVYQLTGDRKYLDLAKQCDAFVEQNLRSPSGLIWDNVSDTGHLDPTFYTYNQGTAIRADLSLYQVTGDASYLARAKKTAEAAVAYYGQEDRLWKQPPAFNAIFFRELLQLDAVAPDPSYRQMMTTYLDRAWNEGRLSNGLFGAEGMGAYGGPAPQSIDQGAFLQMYSLLAMTPEQLAQVS